MLYDGSAIDSTSPRQVNLAGVNVPIAPAPERGLLLVEDTLLGPFFSRTVLLYDFRSGSVARFTGGSGAARLEDGSCVYFSVEQHNLSTSINVTESFFGGVAPDIVLRAIARVPESVFVAERDEAGGYHIGATLPSGLVGMDRVKVPVADPLGRPGCDLHMRIDDDGHVTGWRSCPIGSRPDAPYIKVSDSDFFAGPLRVLKAATGMAPDIPTRRVDFSPEAEFPARDGAGIRALALKLRTFHDQMIVDHRLSQKNGVALPEILARALGLVPDPEKAEPGHIVQINIVPGATNLTLEQAMGSKAAASATTLAKGTESTSGTGGTKSHDPPATTKASATEPPPLGGLPGSSWIMPIGVTGGILIVVALIAIWRKRHG